YDFRHVTSSPYFAQSNGEAERAVKMVKSLLKKNTDPYKALLAYRVTPLNQGPSPAELLMGRRFWLLQVKLRVQQFMEKMLQQIGAEHWPAGGADVSSAEGGPDNGMGPLHAHALVVSHGAYMCVAVRYFVEELRCSAPAGCDRKRMFSLSPNAGICRFNLTVVRQGARYVVSGLRCVFIHRVGGAEQDE
ncbi:PREDICTED: probable fructose-2,6-bisphosphatase TIGAR A, partial [Poecilia mexicana]|uniref:probable fructose-2,6-bisphosphatase TIGAR A n=1 Tax=Poecilia mexicana TaxID=48701 RepID=UPI00072DF09D